MGRGAVGRATLAVGGGRKYTGVERDSGIFPIALHALIIATIVLNFSLTSSWSGEYCRVRTCHD
jgi:hypothetical protein